MMDYEIFKDVIEDQIKDYLPDSFKNADILIRRAHETNESYDEICAILSDEKMSPAVGIKYYYEKYREKENIQSILKELAGSIVELHDIKKEVEDIVDLDNVQHNILYAVVNTEANREFLENAPHRQLQDLSVVYRIRVKKYTASDVSKAERHNERKNETYENMNVIEERIPFNVHFKTPTAPTYMEQLKQMETDGLVSLRGLRKDATIFNEIVIDVNTMYFERNGGYEYAKQFYEEAFHFIEEKFGAENVISAVMHADEINIAATEELGKEVYHYHLHAMVLPVVEKEILWSKRCKDEKLRGTVKEVVHQISHSKKWKSDIPLTDEKGNPLLRKNGKPMFRASYSILQDELFNHMTEQGFKGFQRGEYGSTAEHLTSLQYQIKQDNQCTGEAYRITSSGCAVETIRH